MIRRLGQRGDTLVEVALALAILTMVLSGAFSVAAKAYRVGQDARERSIAVNMLQSQAEALRGYRDQSAMTWVSFSSNVGGFGGSDFHMNQTTGGGTQVAAGPITSGFYTIGIKAHLLPPGTDMYQFDIHVDWQPQGGGPTNTSTITTYLTNLSALHVCDNSAGGC